jgi:hypothetical protein
MKLKHYGVISILIIILSALVVACYAFYSLQPENITVDIKRQPPMPDLKVPDTATLNEMAVLAKKAAALAFPDIKKKTEPDTTILGYTPTKSKDYKKRDSEHSPQRLSEGRKDYSLSFIMTSKTSNVCMIDGMLIKKGAILPGGETLIKIESHGVLIEKAGNTRWLNIGE